MPAALTPTASLTSSAELVQRFLAGRSAATADAYRRDLAAFAAWMGADMPAAVARLLGSEAGPANALVLDWLNHLRDLGRSAATINRQLASLRSLVKLARLLGRVAWAIEVDSEAVQSYRDTRGPGKDGVARLLKTLAAKPGPKAARDTAILRLMWGLGLRRGEVVSLDLEHVDLAAGTVAVLGKGRARSGRMPLTLPHETSAALLAWLVVRGREPGPLFTNFDRAGKAGRLTTTSVYRMVAELGDRAGVKARPHGIRHAAITTVLDLSKGNQRAAAKFSRHKNLATLAHYDDSREDLAGQMARLVSAAI